MQKKFEIEHGVLEIWGFKLLEILYFGIFFGRFQGEKFTFFPLNFWIFVHKTLEFLSSTLGFLSSTLGFLPSALVDFDIFAKIFTPA